MGRIRHLRLHLSRPAETGLSPEELTVLLGEQEKTKMEETGEEGGQKGNQESGVRNQKSEVRSQKSEVRSQKA